MSFLGAPAPLPNVPAMPNPLGMVLVQGNPSTDPSALRIPPGFPRNRLVWETPNVVGTIFQFPILFGAPPSGVAMPPDLSQAYIGCLTTRDPRAVKETAVGANDGVLAHGIPINFGAGRGNWVEEDARLFEVECETVGGAYTNYVYRAYVPAVGPTAEWCTYVFKPGSDGVHGDFDFYFFSKRDGGFTGPFSFNLIGSPQAFSTDFNGPPINDTLDGFTRSELVAGPPCVGLPSAVIFNPGNIEVLTKAAPCTLAATRPTGPFLFGGFPLPWCFSTTFSADFFGFVGGVDPRVGVGFAPGDALNIFGVRVTVDSIGNVFVDCGGPPSVVPVATVSLLVMHSYTLCGINATSASLVIDGGLPITVPINSGSPGNVNFPSMYAKGAAGQQAKLTVDKFSCNMPGSPDFFAPPGGVATDFYTQGTGFNGGGMRLRIGYKYAEEKKRKKKVCC